MFLKQNVVYGNQDLKKKEIYGHLTLSSLEILETVKINHYETVV